MNEWSPYAAPEWAGALIRRLGSARGARSYWLCLGGG